MNKTTKICKNSLLLFIHLHSTWYYNLAWINQMFCPFLSRWKVQVLKLSKLSSHQSAFISGFRLERCLRTHIRSHERIHLMWYETHEWRSGKAKLTHITQKDREHKSGTLEELRWSYQAEKQTSLQRTLQRVNQILQQQPLTHAHLSKPESNSHRGEPECTWVEWTSNVMY